MDNDLLFNISLTLNGIRDSLNTSVGIKSWMPVITGFTGVFFGVFANFFVGAATHSSKIRKYKKCIRVEIELIRTETNKALIYFFKLLDSSLKEERVPGFSYFSKTTCVCFDNYFHEVIYHLKNGDFARIVNVYSAAKVSDAATDKMASVDWENDDQRELQKKLNDVISTYFHLHDRCDQYFNGYDKIQDPTPEEIAINLGASYKVIDYLKHARY